MLVFKVLLPDSTENGDVEFSAFTFCCHKGDLSVPVMHLNSGSESETPLHYSFNHCYKNEK